MRPSNEIPSRSGRITAQELADIGWTAEMIAYLRKRHQQQQPQPMPSFLQRAPQAFDAAWLRRTATEPSVRRMVEEATARQREQRRRQAQKDEQRREEHRRRQGRKQRAKLCSSPKRSASTFRRRRSPAHGRRSPSPRCHHSRIAPGKTLNPCPGTWLPRIRHRKQARPAHARNCPAVYVIPSQHLPYRLRSPRRPQHPHLSFLRSELRHWLRPVPPAVTTGSS